MDKETKLYIIALTLVGITAILVIINIILTMTGIITSESIIWTIAVIPAVIGDIIGIYDMIYMIINNACKKDKR